MKATVIIPTLNAAAGISAQLEALKSQSMSDHEVLVIDSLSDDSTRKEAAAAGARVRTVPRREFSHGGTRNLAARSSCGEYLVFLTQDAFPVDDRLLENLLAPMEQNERIAVAYGRQIAYSNAWAIEKIFRGLHYPDFSSTRDRGDIGKLGVKTFFCSNACAAYRRGTFERLGMFRHDTIMNEDMEFVYRALMEGFSVRYAAHAMVWHSHRYSLLRQFRRYVDIGVFFEDNRHLAALSRNEAEGRKYLGQAAGLLLREGGIASLAHLILDCAARYAGYRVGSRHRSLPTGVLKRISLNRAYWRSGP
jgi:rhamnosyltransferase